MSATPAKLPLVLRRVLLVLGLVVVSLVFWNLTGASPSHTTKVKSTNQDRAVKSTVVRLLDADERSASPAVAAASSLPTEPIEVAAMPFDGIARAGRLERREELSYLPMAGEPDVRAGFDLPETTPLRRVRSVYAIPGFSVPYVRVDEIFEASSPVAVVAPQASSALSTPSSEQADPVVLASASAPQDSPSSSSSPSSRKLWQNALAMDCMMVQAEAGVTQERLAQVLPPGVQVARPLSLQGLYLVKWERSLGLEVESARSMFESLEEVAFAEPNYLTAGSATVPNDPGYAGTNPGPQWFLKKMGAEKGWDVFRGHTDQAMANSHVVVVLDTGGDLNHPDLASQWWINPGESGEGRESDGLDNDQDGAVDNVRGFNFLDGNSLITDDVGHGTWVASIIGAKGNNGLGLTGVAWNVKLFPLKIIKGLYDLKTKRLVGTYGTYDAAIGALNCVQRLNLQSQQVAVCNHSWGGQGYSRALFNVINNSRLTLDPLPSGLTSTFAKDKNVIIAQGSAMELAKLRVGMTVTGSGIPAKTVITLLGSNSITLSNYTTLARTATPLTFSNPVEPVSYKVLHVAAAGNSKANCDRFPVFPACVPSGYVLSVGACDATDAPSVWGGAGTNYGALTVDIFAGGTTIWGARAGGTTYEARNGTSGAAPFVSGAAVLLRMWAPDLDERQARQIIIEQALPSTKLKGKCLSGGRLDLAKVMDRLYAPNLVGSGGSTGGVGETTRAMAIGQGMAGRVAKGNDYTLAIYGGQVFAWGSNRHGQLGPNGPKAGPYGWPEAESPLPVIVPGIDDAIMVAAQGDASYVLRSNGTVWGFGGSLYGGFGQSGQPVQVTGLWDSGSQPQAIWIAAADGHVVIANQDGSVYAWGKNEEGQLGNGTTISSRTPVKVQGITDAVMVFAGHYRSFAIRADGMVLWWGNDQFTDMPVTVPQPIPNLTEVTFIASTLSPYEDRHTAYFVREDGTVWYWGGMGAGPSSHWPEEAREPRQFEALSDIVYISAGELFAVAMDASGDIWTWGDDLFGSLGRGPNPSWIAPERLPYDFTEGVGSFACNRFSTVLTTGSGQIMTWGRNVAGELGNGVSSTRAIPARIEGLSQIDRMAPLWNGMARKIDGTWVTWGGAWEGNSPEEMKPQPFTGFPAMESAVAAHSNTPFTLARKPDGTLWAWGWNRYGELGLPVAQLGTGPSSPELAGQVPVAGAVVSYSASSGEDELSDMTHHAVAALADGTVQAWGRNHRGQVGDGTTTDRRLPVTVTGLADVVEVAAGGAHTLARTRNGTVFAWGRNSRGQLGDGTIVDRLTPVPVTSISGAVQLAAGDATSVVLLADGSVWEFGHVDWAAQANYDYAKPISVPRKVAGLPFISSVFIANDAVFALDSLGRVWAWGDSPRILGRALPPSVQVPPFKAALVVGLPRITQLSASPSCMYALSDTGEVFAWGDNWHGGLGNGEISSAIPITVAGFGGVAMSVSSYDTTLASSSWQLSQFGISQQSSPLYTDSFADPDGDGLCNLLEYAIGTAPLVRNTGAQPVARIDTITTGTSSTGLFSVGNEGDLTPGGRHLVLSVRLYQGQRSDLDYIVEVSNDLVNWRSGEPDTATLVDTAELIEVASTAVIDTSPTQWMRLRIRRKGSNEAGAVSNVISSQLKLVTQVQFTQVETSKAESAGTVNVYVTASPAPAVAFSVPITFEGPATLGVDYTTTTSGTISFARGQVTAVIAIKLTADMEIERRESITLRLGDPSTGVILGSRRQHVIRIVDDEVQFASQPSAMMIQAGRPLLLQAPVLTEQSAAYQWLKNNLAIAGAIGQAYGVPSALVSHAGTYRLRVTGSAGTTLGQEVPVVVADLGARSWSALPGATVIMTVPAAGPGLSFRWMRGGVPVTTDARITGATSASLIVRKLAPGDEADYTCEVTCAAGTFPTAIHSLRIMRLPLPLSAVPTAVNLMMGQETDLAPPFDQSQAVRPSSYSIDRLPSGLKLNAVTGRITGRPLQAITTPLVCRMTGANIAGKVSTYLHFTIDALPSGAAGTFTGTVDPDEDINNGVGGRFDVTITPTGSWTGKIYLGYYSYSVSGWVMASRGSSIIIGTATITLPYSDVPLTIAFDFGANGNVHLFGHVNLGSSEASFMLWPKMPTAGGRDGLFTGTFARSELTSPGPKGEGYVTLSTSVAGIVTISGCLADGVVYTGTTHIGPGGEVAIYHSSALADAVAGRLTVASDQSLSGYLHWKRIPQWFTNSLVHYQGFGPLGLSCTGARYTKPAATEWVLGLADKPFNATLELTHSSFLTPAKALLTLKAGGLPGPTATIGSTQAVTFTFTPANGVFFGTLTTRRQNLNQTGEVSLVSSFRGVLVQAPSGQVARGFHLTPDVPPAGNTAVWMPSTSGLATISPSP